MALSVAKASPDLPPAVFRSEKLWRVSVPKDKRYLALCYIFMLISKHHGGRLRFPEVCMHFCWMQRAKAIRET